MSDSTYKTIDIDTLLLWSKFNQYMFYEKEHYYTFNGERVKTSVTQFVGSLSPLFDKESISKKISINSGIPQEEILAEWQKAADISCTLGTMFHLRSELYAQGKQFELDYSPAEKLGYREEVEERMTKLIPMQNKFFENSHGKLIPLKTEFTVGLGKYIAGNIDLLAWNEKDQEIQVWDYKTNKKINMKNDFHKKMLYEFSNLDDCEFCHYSVQLNIYKAILERVLNIKIGKCYIIWFNENNESYQTIKCLDLQDQVNKALDRICKD